MKGLPVRCQILREKSKDYLAGHLADLTEALDCANRL